MLVGDEPLDVYRNGPVVVSKLQLGKTSLTTAAGAAAGWRSVSARSEVGVKVGRPEVGVKVGRRSVSGRLEVGVKVGRRSCQGRSEVVSAHE